MSSWNRCRARSGTTPAGCAQPLGPPIATMRASSRIVQAAQRLQPPANFVQAVDNDVFILDRLRSERVRMLVQEPSHGPFVPVVQRAGLVSHKEDDILAQSVDVIHVGHQVPAAVACRVEQQHVGGLQVALMCGQFLGPTHRGERKELERAIGLGLQLLQFAVNSRYFSPDVVLGTGCRPSCASWYCGVRSGFGYVKIGLTTSARRFGRRFEFRGGGRRPRDPRQRRFPADPVRRPWPESCYASFPRVSLGPHGRTDSSSCGSEAGMGIVRVHACRSLFGRTQDRRGLPARRRVPSSGDGSWSASLLIVTLTWPGNVPACTASRGRMTVTGASVQTGV